ncbi:MAG: hypothetical protein NC453_19035 [Muribaculum sp.]|nr:hypothetical protein [Muribaculum sp.]
MRNFITDSVEKLKSRISNNGVGGDVLAASPDSTVSMSVKTLADCETVAEVTEMLTTLSESADQSIAYALKAQLQVIKYISSAELVGSTFDLLFKNVKKSLEYANAEEADFIKEKTALLLSNFIFFMKAKLVWEVTDNRKKMESDLVNTSNDLAGNILEISNYSSNMEYTAEDTLKLGKILFDPKKENDGWYRNFKRHFFAGQRIKEKEVEFLRSLDLLAKKLETKKELLGKNDLIAGLFENYKDKLVELHSPEWQLWEKKAKACRHKSWSMALVTLFTGLIIGMGLGYILLNFGLPALTVNAESLTIGGSWLLTMLMWVGIASLTSAVIVGLSYRHGGRKYLIKAQKAKEDRTAYYDNLILEYREPALRCLSR